MAIQGILSSSFLDWVKKAEAAAIFGLPPSAITKAIAAGKLKQDDYGWPYPQYQKVHLPTVLNWRHRELYPNHFQHLIPDDRRGGPRAQVGNRILPKMKMPPNPKGTPKAKRTASSELALTWWHCESLGCNKALAVSPSTPPPPCCPWCKSRKLSRQGTP